MRQLPGSTQPQQQLMACLSHAPAGVKCGLQLWMWDLLS